MYLVIYHHHRFLQTTPQLLADDLQSRKSFWVITVQHSNTASTIDFVASHDCTDHYLLNGGFGDEVIG